MSKTPEQIELHELEQGNTSDTGSEASGVTSFAGGETEEDLTIPQDCEHLGHECPNEEASCVGSTSGTASASGKAAVRFYVPENKSEVSAHEGKASDQERYSSENSSDDSSNEGESILRTPINNKGKQRATESPRSILKKDTGKERAVVPSPKDNKHTTKTKRCTRCNRPVSKLRPRRFASPVNSTAEEATGLNTIYNLEGYHTSDPVTILCDRCRAVGKALDRYKKVTMSGREFVRGTEDSRKMGRKYRGVVIEREKSLTKSEKRKTVRASKKPATVSFAEGVFDGAGVRSGAASAASSASTVSFAPLPEPVDGVGAVRRRASFYRTIKKNYKPGRWSWEAMWERGDLDEYDYDEDVNSSSDNESSLASSLAESSATGATRGAAQQQPEDRDESQGWLDTSGFTLRYKDYYTGVKGPAKGKDASPKSRRSRFDSGTRTIRRKKEPTTRGYVKELGKFWCCF